MAKFHIQTADCTLRSYQFEADTDDMDAAVEAFWNLCEELPDGWIDTSWHNDELPSYSSNGLQVFISPDDGVIYIICDVTDGETYLTTKDWKDCVKFVEGFGK